MAAKQARHSERVWNLFAEESLCRNETGILRRYAPQNDTVVALRSYFPFVGVVGGGVGCVAPAFADASSDLAESKNCCTILRAAASIILCPTDAIKPPTWASPV